MRSTPVQVAYQPVLTAAIGYARRGLQRVREGKIAAAWGYYGLARLCTADIETSMYADAARRLGRKTAQEMQDNYQFSVHEESAVGPLHGMLNTLRDSLRRAPDWTPAAREIDRVWKLLPWDSTGAPLATRIKAAQDLWKPVVATYDTGASGAAAQKVVARLWGNRSATPLGPTELPCWKCSGFGYIPWYSHYASGVCFSCGGSGREKAMVTVEIAPTTSARVRVRLPDADAYRTLLNKKDIREEVVRPASEIRDWYAKRAQGRAPWASIMASKGYTTMVPTGAAADLFVPGVGSPAKT